MRTVIVYGPQGCGKTMNAIFLQGYFGCFSVVDDWTKDTPLTPGALHLTNTISSVSDVGHAALAGLPKHGIVETFPYAEAMHMASLKPEAKNPLDVQVGGGHYKGKGIQPIEYIYANNLDFLEGCIVKRITRWKEKDGIKDLEKIKHEVDLLIEMNKRKGNI